MGSIPELLRSSRTIAVVGLSSKKDRPSHWVSEYMQQAGYRIIPVNPRETEVLGEKARAAGLAVVMDRCILKEHRKLVAQRTQR